jgi:hypothetical protein
MTGMVFFTGESKKAFFFQNYFCPEKNTDYSGLFSSFQKVSNFFLNDR